MACGRSLETLEVTNERHDHELILNETFRPFEKKMNPLTPGTVNFMVCYLYGSVVAVDVVDGRWCWKKREKKGERKRSESAP